MVICTLRVIPAMSPPLAASGAQVVYAWNSRGGGPRFMKLGKHVRHKVAEVEAREHQHYVEQAN
ncbi:hypothetical protein Mro03_13190 [Microbispora rosea subsp. rosea]|nr:hypothetical protein Mro03_13190 [Microbispora rosea subsp. rosea]